jgi:hypothetical protein
MKESISADSDAFRQEYQPTVNEQALRKDIESYLGEYRFALPKYDYQLVYSDGHLQDPLTDEPMIEKARRAIQRRTHEWKNTSRERAELEGISFLDQWLKLPTSQHSIVWLSPPGPETDGYGDYGFVYIGAIGKTEQDNKTIDMSAYRVTSPSLTQFNVFASQLVGHTDYQNAEGLLSMPMIVNETKDNLEEVLSLYFNYAPDQNRNKDFDSAIFKLKPHIDKFIKMVRAGAAKNELRRVFDAIENYAIDQQAPFNITFEKLRINYSFPPPQVKGSCGATGGRGLTSGSDILRGGSLSEILSPKNEPFKCPNCHQESHGPVGNQCPHCKITKDEAVKKGLITC